MAWSALVVVALSAIASAQPRIQFATYLGGAGSELARGVATDSAGNIYVAGRTDSVDFPLKDPVQPRGNAFAQIFLAKFAPDGTLLRSTTLGGSDNDEAVAIAVDAAGFIYLTGDLHSMDFQVTNAFQRNSGGAVDAFVMKLDPSFQVIYATYFGGRANDLGYAIVADAGGAAYICGRTESRDFPVTPGALLTDFGRGHGAELRGEVRRRRAACLVDFSRRGEHDQHELSQRHRMEHCGGFGRPPDRCR